jgi:plastocyanin
MKLLLAKPLIYAVGILTLSASLAGSAFAGDIQGKVTVQGLRSAANIVVYVDAIPGQNFGAPGAHATMDQRKMTFLPHVLPVLKGTTVDFLNSDAVGHNVYWPSISGNKGAAGNLGTWPQGQTKSFQFNTLGAAPLLCNVHAEMSGYVVVLPTPYFAVTNATGAFTIRGVPAGHYTLKTWSESGKPTVQQIDVGAGPTAVQLTVSR